MKFNGLNARIGVQLKKNGNDLLDVKKGLTSWSWENGRIV